MTFRLFTILLCLNVNLCFGDALEKGFERLKIYDYFQAKINFEKAIKNKPSGAAYGLSLIYASNNNPFYNLDSAWACILFANSTWKSASERLIKDYGELGISINSIIKQQEEICSRAFKEAENAGTVYKLNYYMSHFPGCKQLADALLLRNKVAFEDTRKIHTAAAYQDFMKQYPESNEYNEARTFYEERLFEEITVEKNIEGYTNYLSLYPDGPFRQEAEKMIYQLSTATNSIAEYDAYLKKYPGSQYINDAWKQVYHLMLKEFNEANYRNFIQKYPGYPFMKELEADYKLMNSQLLPFKKNNLWGYINEDGKEIIKPLYDECSLFAEGLAVVKQNGKYGFINKAGKTIVPFVYDEAESFKNNSAVVVVNEKFGLINKQGDTLISFLYDDLSDPAEGLTSVIYEDQSGYVDLSGNKLTDFTYDFAGDFQDGFAVIGMEDKYGIIRKNGVVVVKPLYDQLIYIENGLYRARLNNKWGVLTGMGEIKVPLNYQMIGEFSEGKALVAKAGKCGIMNTDGKIIAPLTYAFTENLLNTARYQNGFILIKQKNKSVLLDSLGNKFNVGNYEDIGLPGEGRIAVRKNKKWGYASLNGKIIIPCKYNEAMTFTGNYAKVVMKTQVGIIDTVGKFILPPLYQDVEIKPNYFLTRENNLFGIQGMNGMMLLPREYDKINFISNKTAEAWKGDKRTYINIVSGKILFTEN